MKVLARRRRTRRLAPSGRRPGSVATRQAPSGRRAAAGSTADGRRTTTVASSRRRWRCGHADRGGGPVPLRVTHSGASRRMCQAGARHPGPRIRPDEVADRSRSTPRHDRAEAGRRCVANARGAAIAACENEARARAATGTSSLLGRAVPPATFSSARASVGHCRAVQRCCRPSTVEACRRVPWRSSPSREGAGEGCRCRRGSVERDHYHSPARAYGVAQQVYSPPKCHATHFASSLSKATRRRPPTVTNERGDRRSEHHGRKRAQRRQVREATRDKDAPRAGARPPRRPPATASGAHARCAERWRCRPGGHARWTSSRSRQLLRPSSASRSGIRDGSSCATRHSGRQTVTAARVRVVRDGATRHDTLGHGAGEAKTTCYASAERRYHSPNSVHLVWTDDAGVPRRSALDELGAALLRLRRLCMPGAGKQLGAPQRAIRLRAHQRPAVNQRCWIVAGWLCDHVDRVRYGSSQKGSIFGKAARYACGCHFQACVAHDTRGGLLRYRTPLRAAGKVGSAAAVQRRRGGRGVGRRRRRARRRERAPRPRLALRQTPHARNTSRRRRGRRTPRHMSRLELLHSRMRVRCRAGRDEAVAQQVRLGRRVRPHCTCRWRRRAPRRCLPREPVLGPRLRRGAPAWPYRLGAAV